MQGQPVGQMLGSQKRVGACKRRPVLLETIKPIEQPDLFRHFFFRELRALQPAKVNFRNLDRRNSRKASLIK
jgi:hypothetical protein